MAAAAIHSELIHFDGDGNDNDDNDSEHGCWISPGSVGSLYMSQDQLYFTGDGEDSNGTEHDDNIVDILPPLLHERFRTAS